MTTTADAPGATCPAGAFDPLGAEYLADPYPLLARARAEEPVFYAPEIDVWVVTRYADVEAVFLDPARFSAGVAQSPLLPLGPEAAAILKDGFRASPTMSNADPPKHARIRPHAAKPFTPRRMALLEPTIRGRTRALVDAMVAGSPAAGGPADLVASLAFPLPAITVFALVGFPEEDTELLKSWCGDRLVVTWGRPSPEVQAQVARNMVAYWGYCERFVASRFADPQDDYTSDLVRTSLGDPEALSAHEITNVVYGLSFAGHETTTNLIANTVRQLLAHRDQWDALLADPSLVPNAVEETLRYDTSVIAWRRVTTEPVELGGVAVPEGAKLLLVLGSTGRDPAHFADPDRFDVARPNARTHLAFGKGIHFCLGAYLARREVAVVVEELATRLPSLRLVDGQPLDFAPNVSFRGPVRLEVEWEPAEGRPRS